MLIKRLLAQKADVPDNAEGYLRDPKKYLYVSQFSITNDFKRYTAESNGKGFTFDQWRSHFKNVMGSPKLTVEEKVELLIRGGFPQKHKSGGNSKTPRLTGKRVRFIGEVVRKVRRRRSRENSSCVCLYSMYGVCVFE